jgi:hypothetical protein
MEGTADGAVALTGSVAAATRSSTGVSNAAVLERAPGFAPTPRAGINGDLLRGASCGFDYFLQDQQVISWELQLFPLG